MCWPCRSSPPVSPCSSTTPTSSSFPHKARARLLMAQVAPNSNEDIRCSAVPRSRQSSADGHAEVQQIPAEVERTSEEFVDVEASGHKIEVGNPTNHPHACEYSIIYPKIQFAIHRTPINHCNKSCHQSLPTSAVCMCYTSSRQFWGL